MLSSLAASYGLFAAYAVRFIFPKRASRRKRKMFIAFAEQLPVGGALRFETPDGEEFLLTKTDSPTAPYMAYSSLCPHLGCKVLWKSDEQQFICPCHAGAFNASGEAIAGPPLKEGQKLKSCEIIQDGDSIYAMVRTI